MIIVKYSLLIRINRASVDCLEFIDWHDKFMANEYDQSFQKKNGFRFKRAD